MHWAKYKASAPRKDINLPATLNHRSVDGHTLMLVPGHTYELTDEEWAHLKAEHGHLVPHFQKLGKSA